MGSHHPECPQRLTAINDHLIAQGIDAYFVYYDAPLATFEQLLRVHPAPPERIKRASPELGVVHLDPDTAMNPHTWQAGAALGRCRLPGGRSGDEQGSRKCLLLRAPAWPHARGQPDGLLFQQHRCRCRARHQGARPWESVAIIDFDVHHGNGTEGIAAPVTIGS